MEARSRHPLLGKGLPSSFAGGAPSGCLRRQEGAVTLGRQEAGGRLMGASAGLADVRKVPSRTTADAISSDVPIAPVQSICGRGAPLSLGVLRSGLLAQARHLEGRGQIRRTGAKWH